ncbi:MAG: M23 family metallopeptidase [Clostridium sp.]|nr:M23 family metallopeptidase [Clostridium sp.]MCM1443938.1 M23 family metallopeptidase [Candidatus Amulumruptor caecigallinarius]
MTYRRLKKPVIYSAYLVGFILIISSILLIRKTVLKNNDNTDYVTKTIFEDIIPVIGEDQENTVEQIINPYTDPTVQITKNFYDYKANEKEQIDSIIYYEGTYIPSTGLTFKGEGTFDIVAILSGTVQSIKEDDLLGTIIEIKHEDDIISVYQSVKEVNVKENDTISQGQVIATSGNSNIDKESGEHLYFELIINNETVNPSDYIGKLVNEI